ncbi:MAG: fibronectin type III domain-containing protein, partial [Prolixibacteraceae bacterium]
GTPFNVTVTVNPTATVSSSNHPANRCNTVETTYTSTSATTAATFAWTRAAVEGISNAAVTNGTGAAITETLTNTTANPLDVVYIVTPTIDGCTGTPFNITVTVNALPAITTTGIAAAVIYSESSRTTKLVYSATSNAPISYSIDWNAAANTAGLADQGSTANEFVEGGGTLSTIAINGGTPGGIYNGIMTITNANGCTSTQAISVTITNIAITATAIAGVTPPVAGSTPVTSIIAGTGYTGIVTWSPAVATFGYNTIYTATITLTASVGFTFTGVTANHFTIAGSLPIASNSANSGVITAAFPATGAAPVPSSGSGSARVVAGLSSSDADNVICAGDEVTFTGTGAGSGTYEFFVDGVIQGVASSIATFTTNSLKNGEAVTVRVANSSGVSSASAGIITTVNALPTPAALTGTQIVCVGSTSAFACTTSGGIWSSGTSANATVNASTGEIIGISAGTSLITYHVTNSSGCINTVTQTVTVSSIPTVNAITGTQIVCVGSTTDFASTTNGGVWTSGTTANATVNASTGVITGVAAGTSLIAYTVTNTSGCVNAANRMVTVNALPIVNAITGTQSVCVGSTTTFANATTGGVWTSGTTANATVNASTGVLTGVAAGTSLISYTITNSSGCATTVAQTVTVNPQPSILSSLSAARCDAGTVSLDATASEGTISWYAAATGGISLGTGASFTTPVIAVSKDYYAEAVSAGCISKVRKSVTATINPSPIAPVVTSITQPTCSTANATVILSGFPVPGNWTLTKSPVGTTITSSGQGIVLNDVVKGTYTFRVTSAEGCTSPESADVVINAQPTLPAAPVSKAATIVSQTGFTANWDAAANATGYLLDVATDTGFKAFVSGYSGTNAGNTANYSVTGLTANTTYYYRVRAFNACGTGIGSGTIAVTTPITVPTVSTALPATNILQSGFTANWSACTTTTGYWLDVATDIGFTNFVTGYNNKDAGNVTSSGITGLNSMITYYFRVRAYNTSGTGGNSNTATTITLSVPPAAPVGLVVSSSCNNLVILKWKKNAGPYFKRYRIYGGTSTNPTTRLDSTGTSASDTTKTISSLTEGMTYYFRVTSVNNDGAESPYSAETKAVLIVVDSPVISMKWDDVLVCSNLTNSISSYQWYLGNASIPGANDQYYSTNKIPGIYKVITVDNFGCLYSSATITVVTTKSLTIYPNPASVNFTLRLSGAITGKAVISMYNAGGLKVAEVQAENVNEELIKEIAVNNLDNGVYVVQVLVNQQELYYTKMIVKK